MLKAQSLRTRSCSAGVRAAAAFKERLEMNDLTEPEDRSYKDWISTIESDNQTVEEYHKKLGLARASKDNAEKTVAGSERPRSDSFGKDARRGQRGAEKGDK